jgi:hypothetical protein
MRHLPIVLPQAFGRDEFCAERFDYHAGEHVVFGGPTQRGKTTLAFMLLEYTATSECPAYVAVCKPRDRVTLKWGKKLGFRRVEDWPPPPLLQEMLGIESPPPGYLVWPRYGDAMRDVQEAARVTTALLEDRYAAGAREGRKRQKGIMIMDDTVVKSKVMKLDPLMTTHLAMAGAMDLGGWYFVQKPTGSGEASLWAYGASEHIFLLNDGDVRNVKRYGEIGGVDPYYVSAVLQRLRPFEFLYIHRSSGAMAIILAQ